MKKALFTVMIACLFIACEDQESEIFPLWTPSLTVSKTDGAIHLQWFNPMAFLCSYPSRYSEPEVFEIFIAKGSPDHFEKVAAVKNSGDYTFTLNNLENGSYYFAEVKATSIFRPEKTSNRVMVIPSESGNVMRLTPVSVQSMESGTLAGNSHTLAFTDRNFTWDNGRYGNMALFVLDLDSKENRIIDTSAYYPDWSPDGSKLVFCTDKKEHTEQGSRPQQIAVLDLPAETITMLTQGDDSNYSPEFSSDGNWIVYSSDAGHQDVFEIWKMKADGTQKTQISDDLRLSGMDYGNISLGRPVWSPDGEYIYFNKVTEEVTDLDIFRIPANGGTVERVIQSPWRDYIPAVSPDHAKIAFISDRSGTSQIWLYETSSDRYQQVTGEERFGIMTYWGKLEWLDANTILFSGYEYGTNTGYGIFTVEIAE